MSNIQYGRRDVYCIKYHLVWCVKYRHEILKGEIENTAKKLLAEIATDHDIEIMEMETDRDHVHLLIACKPQHYIPNVVKALKGVSARYLFKKHPELKQKLWGGHL